MTRARVLPAILLTGLVGCAGAPLPAPPRDTEAAAALAEARCQACGQAARGGVLLADGRATCARCARTAVRDPVEAREVLVAAHRAASAVLRRAAPGLDLSLHRVGVTLVDRPTLQREAADLAGPNLRAVTVVTASAPRVSATIHVLRSLPRDYLLGALAHELVHVWQEQRRLAHRGSPRRGPAPALREGAAVWVQREVLLGCGADSLARALEQNRDPTYGGGLRRFEALVRARGAAEALQLSAWGTFPAGY